MFRCPLSAAAITSVALGCSNIEKAPPVPETVRANQSFLIDVPQIMRGTIASEAIVMGYQSPMSMGYQPVIVRGYGLVVDLDGTGSRDIPPQLRAHMLAEAAKGGIGSERFGPEVGELSPERLLDSPDTAIVVVEGIVPQGAVQGTQFDVRVYADPRTGTTSLESGRLYTTQLRPGQLQTGGAQAFEIATANGPVFVNPFAEPGAVGRDTVIRTSGRILNGGVVVKDMPLTLRLANPSHARASILQSAINTRFPKEPGQRDPTARGESDELLTITVPHSFRQRTDEFIELLRHTTIRQSNPEAVAMFVQRTLLADPSVAEAASLRWRALGNRAIPIIRGLYNHAERLPRMASLRAGAKLDDQIGVMHLIDLAQNGEGGDRLEAIDLLAEMSLNPQIEIALREFLNDNDVEVRMRSYEALALRRDPYLRRYEVDGKFVLDIVDSEEPMVYVTQTGVPRIVLFGQGIQIERPVTMRAWSNRFMIKGDTDDEKVEVYYRPPGNQSGIITQVEPDLESLVQFLAQRTSVDTPSPGLGFSYGETVGALHQMWRQKYIAADFKADQDRILAAIMNYERGRVVNDRPEFTNPESTVFDQSLLPPVYEDRPEFATSPGDS